MVHFTGDLPSQHGAFHGRWTKSENGAFHGRSAESQNGAFHGKSQDAASFQNAASFRRMRRSFRRMWRQDAASFYRMRRHFTGCGDFTGSASRRMMPFHGKIGRSHHGATQDAASFHRMGRHFTGCGVISQDVVILKDAASFQNAASFRRMRRQDAASFHRMRRHFTGCGDFTGSASRRITGCTGNRPKQVAPNHRVGRSQGRAKSQGRAFHRVAPNHRVGISQGRAKSQGRQITGWGHFRDFTSCQSNTRSSLLFHFSSFFVWV
jgi:hypothetical protein